ncbi:MAG TPA: bifunctional glutamate N-acetyltransferase/amino-acid acetyltransferase ArgJ [Nitrospirales bacterium]|jgi:glutamate N-acetyltransferase/amino-acid N-acetyltransferase
MNSVEGGITAVPGILAAGICAGIKKTHVPDLALIVSERQAAIAGVLTRNQVVAAPVLHARKHLRRGRARAIVANSGNANACTGRQGVADTKEMAALVADLLGCSAGEVFVGSTGVIGKPLPMDRIRTAIPRLVPQLSRHGGHKAAQAIMTTDTTVKMAAASRRIAGRRITLGGIAKGSGMVHPNMGTMLCYLATDVLISPAMLRRALRIATDQSFNRIPLDGDTSTNDMVLCLANGCAGNRPFTSASSYAQEFQALLNTVCRQLAQMIARDGEGATKFVELRVTGARTETEAIRVANTIATSSLVKTAWFGQDSNWGRIMAAIGRAGVPIAEDRIGIFYGDIPVVRRGVGLGQAAESKANTVLKQREFTLIVHLGLGRASAIVWTSDLSIDYVKINASYRS